MIRSPLLAKQPEVRHLIVLFHLGLNSSFQESKSRPGDDTFHRLRVKTADEHRHTQPLAHHIVVLARLDADEEKALRPQPPIDAPQDRLMFQAWNMLQRVEGHHGVKRAWRERDRTGIPVHKLTSRHVLACKVDLRLRNIDAGNPVLPRDLDIRRIA